MPNPDPDPNPTELEEAQIKALVERIRPLAEQLQKIKAEARALGMFAEDRDLLECGDCGLIEDVDIQGRLFTYHRFGDKSYPDTGLRFEELEEGRFICPVCGNVLVQQDEEPEL